MTLDKEAEKTILETMGYNVLKQLTMIVPDFFDEKYIVSKLVPKPENEQHTPHILYLHKQVIASTHPIYQAGSIVNLDKVLVDLISEGYNVSLSPQNVRSGFVGPELLEEGPYDGLVIAEVSKEETGFGNPRVFYANSASLLMGREIRYGELEKRDFFEASSRRNIHFAFVQEEPNKKRRPVAMDKGWRIIR